MKMTIHEASRMLKEKKISSVELTGDYLERINKLEPKVHAFVTVTEEQALEQARRADARIKAGDAAPLTGVPLAIKDVICTKGVRTTCSSKMLENFVPPYDAMVMEKLDAAGAVMVAKLTWTSSPWALPRKTPPFS